MGDERDRGRRRGRGRDAQSERRVLRVRAGSADLLPSSRASLAGRRELGVERARRSPPPHLARARARAPLSLSRLLELLSDSDSRKSHAVNVTKRAQPINCTKMGRHLARSSSSSFLLLSRPDGEPEPVQPTTSSSTLSTTCPRRRPTRPASGRRTPSRRRTAASARSQSRAARPPPRPRPRRAPSRSCSRRGCT